MRYPPARRLDLVEELHGHRVADPARPEPAAWRDLVPESGDVLAGYALTDDAVVVASSRHAVGRVAVHDRRTGALRIEVELPGPGSVLGVSARPEGGDEVYLGYTDFVTPPRAYRYQVADGRLELWMDAPGQADDPVRLRRLQRLPDPGLERGHGRLGRAGRGVRDRQPSRW